MLGDSRLSVSTFPPEGALDFNPGPRKAPASQRDALAVGHATQGAGKALGELDRGRCQRLSLPPAGHFLGRSFRSPESRMWNSTRRFSALLALVLLGLMARRSP